MTRSLFINRKSELNKIARFLRQISDRHILFVHGEDGVGKTLILEKVLNQNRKQMDNNVIVHAEVLSYSSLVVELVNIEAAIWTALTQSGYEKVFHEVGSYLASELYGSRRILIKSQPKNPINVGETDILHPLILSFEGDERNTQDNIALTFCQWLDTIAESIRGSQLIILIDVPTSVPPKLIKGLERTFQRTSQKNIRVIFALSSASYDCLLTTFRNEEQKKEIEAALEISPFEKEDALDLTHKLLQSRSNINTLIGKCLNTYQGNPFDLYLGCLSANRDQSLMGLDREGLVRYLLECESPIVTNILIALALVQHPLSFEELESALDISASNLSQEIIASSLIRAIKHNIDPAVRIIHPSVARIVLDVIPSNKVQVICKKLANIKIMGISGATAYRFYASFPRKYVTYLELIKRCEDERYVDFLTSAPSRMLLRQWAATDIALQHLNYIMEFYQDRLSAAEKSLLYRDLGYFAQLEHKKDEARKYFDRSIELLGTGIDFSDKDAPASILEAAEALVDKANYHRKEGNYIDAFVCLKEARIRYEALLEINPNVRDSIESEVARMAHNQGIILRDQGLSEIETNPENSKRLFIQANSYFEEALAVEQLHHNLNGQLEALTQQAVLGAYLGLSDNVDDIFLNITNLGRAFGDMMSIANLAGNLAIVYLSKDAFLPERSYKYAKAAYDTFATIGSKKQQRDAEILMKKAQQHIKGK